MNNMYIYDQLTRSFSKSNNTFKQYLSSLAITIPIGLAIHTFPKIYKLVEKRKMEVAKDKLLASKNEKLNQYFDKYAKEGVGVDNSPISQKKYLAVMQDIFQDVLDYSKYNQKTDDYDENPTIYTKIIVPFIGFLRVILIKDVYILAGKDIGADRTQFELVFEPDPMKAANIAKDPFRVKIFTYKWPSHGFKVTSLGMNEANELIHATLVFLSKNPKYLTIRV